MVKKLEKRLYLELIRAYRDHPFLWDKDDPEYYNKPLKLETWDKFASSIVRPFHSDADRKDVISRIDYLRKRFMHEHWVVLVNKKAGVNYVPRHWVYEEMKFLLKVLKEQPMPAEQRRWRRFVARGGITTRSQDHSFDDPLTKMPVDRISDDNDSPNVDFDTTNDSPTVPRITTIPLATLQHPSVLPLPPLCPLVPAPQRAAPREPSVNSTTSTAGADHREPFLQLITIKLKELNPAKRLLVEKIINDTLFYAEFGELTFDQLRCIENTLKNGHKK